MLLLAVDTAGSTGGVLLAGHDEDRPDRTDTREIEILGARDLQPRVFSAQLIPAIAELLQSSHLGLADVNAFVVVSGPGSFTGLRVGLSAVKALAEATGKPIVALSRLAIMTSMAGKFRPPESADTPVHAVLDAGRGEFYHGIYRGSGKICVGESFQTLKALTASIHTPPGLVVACEPVVCNALAAIEGIVAHEIPSPTARDTLPFAVAAWQADDFRDSATLDANYLRRSDAIVAAKLPGSTLPAQSPGCRP